MEALIPIRDTDSGQLVDARVLHKFVGSGSRFNDWVNRRIDKFGFIEGEDYIIQYSEMSNLGSNNLQDRKDYGLTLDMAKQLCMVENNDKGMEARKYFIECEHVAKELTVLPQLPKDYLGALKALVSSEEEKQVLLETNEAQGVQIEENAPKVEAFDELMDADGYSTMNRAAKVLGLGQNTLFEILRSHNVLMSKGKDRNVPYQKFMSMGWFVVKLASYSKEDGTVGASSTTRVTPKGIDGMRKSLLKYGYITKDDFFADVTEEE